MKLYMSNPENRKCSEEISGQEMRVRESSADDVTVMYMISYRHDMQKPQLRTQRRINLVYSEQLTYGAAVRLQVLVV